MHYTANMLEKPPYRTLEDVPADAKVVYFPLQFEPELSIQGHAPECVDQLTVLTQIALSLPADAVLVVKEHPYQGGRRPHHVYRQILRMPNVVMMRSSVNSQSIIEHATVACAITSTVAHEAAILGKPVAYFNRHAPIRAIPHVRQIRSYEDLAWIRHMLFEDDPVAERQRRADGARYLYALQEYCMDLGSFDMFTRDTAPNDAELDILAEPLLECLSADMKPAA